MDGQDIALSSLFLASKLEESPLRIRDLINVFDYLFKRVSHQRVRIALDKVRAVAGKSRESEENGWEYEPMDYFAKEFYDTKEELVVGEMQILKRFVSFLSCLRG
jgi:hypothetical protein